MTTFHRAEEIFHGAIELESEGERAQFLAAQCGEDDELRALVERLLEVHSGSESSAFSKAPELEGTSPFFDPARPLDVEDVRRLLGASESDDGLGAIAEFQVLSIIGQGGNGIVLKAWDTKLNRFVALKLLSPRLAADPVANQRFIREANAVASICDDRVVSVYSIVESDKTPMICMELVEGPSLQNVIDEQGALSIEQVLRIGLQVAEGLQAAHRQGIVHRDIKPANILLKNGLDQVKIADFGIAQVPDSSKLTITGQFAGTPQFMSPEQAMGRTVDCRSDLFSLGALLYVMCTGRAPFSGDSTIEVIRAVSEQTPPAIREINPAVPRWLELLIERLMDKAPLRRFSSAEEVADSLSRGIAHLLDPVGTRPPDCRRVRIPGAPVFALHLPRLTLDPFLALLVALLIAVGVLPLIGIKSIRSATTFLFVMMPLSGVVSLLAYRWRCGAAAISLGACIAAFSITVMFLTWQGVLAFGGSMTREMVIALFALQLLAVPIGLVALFDSLGKRTSTPVSIRFSLEGLLWSVVLLAFAVGAIKFVSDSWAGISIAVARALFSSVSVLAIGVYLSYRKLEYPEVQWERRRRKWVALASFFTLILVGVSSAASQAEGHGEIILTLEDACERCALTVRSRPVGKGRYHLTASAQSSQRLRLPVGNYELAVTSPAGGAARSMTATQNFVVEGRRTQQIRLTQSDFH